MIEQDTNQTPKQINEQELQAITGGCDACLMLYHKANRSKGGIVSSIKKNLHWSKETVKQAQDKIDSLQAFANDALKSIDKPPKPSYGMLRICEDHVDLSQRLTEIRNR